AMLGPEDPPRDAQELEDATGWPIAIVDANNINVNVLGVSRRVPLTAAGVRQAVLDNPLGQDDERTPIILVRRRA
ncbi:MAG: F420-0--gamma-glutamyl ligase, partial [Candidatus Dormibacteraeota bacterium]|nr:F420-0--gamma-glutamyl ligase [Candidatus Dormibacteraeota bacterium]